ncbi:MAG: hypothetical protein ABEJ80_03700 [Halarchaeum sp.]
MPSIVSRVVADLRSVESLVTLVCVLLAVVSLVAVPVAVSDPPDGLVTMVVFSVGLLVPIQYRARWHARYPDAVRAAAWALVASVATAVVCVALAFAFVALVPSHPRVATGAAFLATFVAAAVVSRTAA